jgi:hypothetical protein
MRTVMRIPRIVRAAAAALVIAATSGAPVASAEIVPRRDGSKAVYVPADATPLASSDSADGFHVDDAVIGSAGTLALMLGAAGAVSLRGRRRSSNAIGAS